MPKVLRSEEDCSVNFVIEKDDGFLEARFVRRSDDYFVIYLSSHSGCSRACRFCHLTATKQTGDTEASFEEYITQAKVVMDYYKDEIEATNPARVVHFNWMSRGEPLANSTMLTRGQELLLELTKIAKQENLIPKFNISTIMPDTLDPECLSKIFSPISPTIYYSLYSLADSFRKRWIPKSLPVDVALDSLKAYQQDSKKIVKIHFAFIKDENDGVGNLIDIVGEVKKRRLAIEFNVVRYNPFSDKQGAETDEATIQRNVKIIEAQIDGEVKLIQRVGFDVNASCGMFFG